MQMNMNKQFVHVVCAFCFFPPVSPANALTRMLVPL